MENIENVLVAKSARGDVMAFRQLYDLYKTRIFGLCRGMLNSDSDAEDALQDIFVKVWTRLKGFRRQSAFSTWLYRVSVNHCRSRLRSKQIRQSTIMKIFHLGRSREQEQKDPPLDNRDLLAWAMTGLDVNARQCVVLKEMQGMTYEQIGSVLGISPGTVKSRVSRAMSKMRKRLKRINEYGKN